MYKIILASSSPRRIEILGKLGVDFEHISPDIDETAFAEETPSEYVERLAIAKALKGYEMAEVGVQGSDNLFVIGGDVTVEIDGKSIGKPENPGEARKIMEMFSERPHFIRNATAIVLNGKVIYSGVENNTVEFKKIPKFEIIEYVENFESDWKDKAGGYAIQGYAGKHFIKKFTGKYFNVMGISIFKIAEILMKSGVNIDPDKLKKLHEKDQDSILCINSIYS